jgi:hypothetical protein
MGKKFGRVRATANNILAKWTAIRKKVSDYKAAQVDGREEELPDREGPTGGGFDESGVEDERMVAADAAEVVRESKSNTRYVAGVDEESMKIIQYFIELFPQSVTGIGLMTEVVPLFLNILSNAAFISALSALASASSLTAACSSSLTSPASIHVLWSMQAQRTK